MTVPSTARPTIGCAALVAAVLLALSGGETASSSAPASQPEGPRQRVDGFEEPASGRTIQVKATDSLQAALAAARGGDVLVLAAGATFNGPFILPARRDEGWITLRSDDSAGIPVSGARLIPARGGRLAVLRSPHSYVLSAAPGAHHYRILGLELAPAPGTFLYNVVLFGEGAWDEGQLPHHIVFDRVHIHGDPQRGSRRGLALNARHVAVLNSHLADFKEVGADSQAIAAWNGSGPFQIVNNYLEAAGENVMFGGADPAIRGLVPSDIEVRLNHFAKPTSWQTGDPSYGGTHWTVKNLLELKNARRVLIDGNLFERNWTDAQAGFAILFTVRNQDGRAPWSTVEDVAFTSNVVRDVAGGLNITGQDDAHPSQRASRFLIAHNLFYRVGAPRWRGEGKLFQILAGPVAVQIDHNTALHASNIVTAEGEPAKGFVFTSNIVVHNQYGVIGTDQAPGLSTIARYFPDGVFQQNLIIGGPARLYPPGNQFPPSLETIGFRDPANEDFRLAETSPLRAGRGPAPPPGVDPSRLRDAWLAAKGGQP